MNDAATLARASAARDRRWHRRRRRVGRREPASSDPRESCRTSSRRRRATARCSRTSPGPPATTSCPCHSRRRRIAWAGVTMPPTVGAVLMSLSTIVVALNAAAPPPSRPPPRPGVVTKEAPSRGAGVTYDSSGNLAESVGFEPTVTRKPQRFSRTSHGSGAGPPDPVFSQVSGHFSRVRSDRYRPPIDRDFPSPVVPQWYGAPIRPGRREGGVARRGPRDPSGGRPIPSTR